MGIREKFNENRWLGVGVPIFVTVVAVGFLFTEVFGHRGIEGISDKAYFTTDDTLTGQAAVDALFSASVSNVPPFDHDGKPAYRAKCFTCNGGRNVWVQYYYRFTPQVRDKVVAAYADEIAKGNRLDPDLSPFIESGMEVKAPGNGPWVGFKDPSFSGITRLTPPPNVPSDDLVDYVP